MLNVREAIGGYVLTLREDELAVPEERFAALLLPAGASFRASPGRKGAGAQKAGFEFKRQHGSHIILRTNTPFAQVAVPDHSELDTGTLRSILRMVGLSSEELIQRL